MALFHRFIDWLRGWLFPPRPGDTPITRGPDDGEDSAELAEREWQERQKERRGETTEQG